MLRHTPVIMVSALEYIETLKPARCSTSLLRARPLL
jgi:hypothetical protein